jgi:Copine
MLENNERSTTISNDLNGNDTVPVPTKEQKTAMLKNRDYTLIIDRSGSMWTKDDRDRQNERRVVRNRWQVMQESTFALASKCEQLDTDGITVYTFSDGFQRYENVTASKVEEIFEDNEPFGCTDLAGVLQDALKNYFQRKERGEAKPNGETILVVTDGKPDDQIAVMTNIIEATKKINKDGELAISLIQIGDDQEATNFLKFLDNELTKKGAKSDIVNTVTMEDIKNRKLTMRDILLNAISGKSI